MSSDATALNAEATYIAAAALGGEVSRGSSMETLIETEARNR